MDRKIVRSLMSGFTVIELTIVVLVLSIIAALLSSILSQGFNGYFEGKNVNSAQTDALLALSYVSNDLRTVRSPSSISVATAGQISFVNQAGDSVTYTRNPIGNRLLRIFNSDSRALSKTSQSLAFKYYDRDGVETILANQIQFINVSMSFALDGNLTQANTMIYLH